MPGKKNGGYDPDEEEDDDLDLNDFDDDDDDFDDFDDDDDEAFFSSPCFPSLIDSDAAHQINLGN